MKSKKDAAYKAIQPSMELSENTEQNIPNLEVPVNKHIYLVYITDIHFFVHAHRCSFSYKHRYIHRNRKSKKGTKSQLTLPNSNRGVPSYTQSTQPRTIIFECPKNKNVLNREKCNKNMPHSG